MTRSEFEHIAAQLRQRVLKVGLDFFSNKEDAEDVAQETMVQLWRYLEHIDAERNVEALAVRGNRPAEATRTTAVRIATDGRAFHR